MTDLKILKKLQEVVFLLFITPNGLLDIFYIGISKVREDTKMAKMTWADIKRFDGIGDSNEDFSNEVKLFLDSYLNLFISI